MVAEAPSIHIRNLTYNFPDGSEGLKNINVDLPPGSRTLLIGGMQYRIYNFFFCNLPLRKKKKEMLMREGGGTKQRMEPEKRRCCDSHLAKS